MIIISESSAHGLVVHVRFVLVKSPQSGDRLAVHQLEDAPVSVHPLDVGWAAGRRLEQREEKLPEVSTAWVLRLLLGPLLLVRQVQL